MFDNILYIPSVCSNILSVGQMSEHGNKIVLQDNLLWVYDNGGRLLMRVQRSANRLYKISLEDTQGSCMLTKVEDDTQVWHSRLGHVNFDAMSLMKRHEMVKGLPYLKHPRKLCNRCLMAKQPRGPFPSALTYKSHKVLELIHGNLCGPISPCTLSGKRYFLHLVDDYSKKMWVYFLTAKSEALEMFTKFRVLVEKNATRQSKLYVQTGEGSSALICSRIFVNRLGFPGSTQRHTPYSRTGLLSEGTELCCRWPEAF